MGNCFGPSISDLERISHATMEDYYVKSCFSKLDLMSEKQMDILYVVS